MSESEPAVRPANLPDDARWEPGKQPGFEWRGVEVVAIDPPDPGQVFVVT